MFRLLPYLGAIKLDKLSVSDVQHMIDKMVAAKCGVRAIHKARQTLSSALGKAMRQELIFRNVSRLVELPAYKPKPKKIFNLEQSQGFLRAAVDHCWFSGFEFVQSYGMRCGEALGLRWTDIDFENDLVFIRQQIQRVEGKLMAVEVKTDKSERVIPLGLNIKAYLQEKAAREGIDLSQNEPCLDFSTDSLIVTSKTGGPVDPHNFSRAYRGIIKKAGLPYATPHAGRHFAATLNKDIGTPLKDTKDLLGHANSIVTEKIYQHGSNDVQRRAITTIDELLHTETGGVATRCNESLQHSLNQDIKISPCKGLFPSSTPVIQLLHPSTKKAMIQGSSALFRPYFTPNSNSMTSIILHLQTRTTMQLLGSVAVMRCRTVTRGRQIRQLCRLILES